MFTTRTALKRFLFCLSIAVGSFFSLVVTPTEAEAPILVNQPKEPLPHKTVVDVKQADIELLARLVYAEGHGESLEGQIAIAAVVLNRMQSDQYPEDLRDVLYQRNAFSSIQDGKLPSKVDDTARQAVREALAGKDPSGGALYFFNPKTATSSWIWSRKQSVVIGHHIFAK